MYTRSLKVPWGKRIDVYVDVIPQDDVAPSQLCDTKIFQYWRSYYLELLVKKVSAFLSVHSFLSIVAVGESSLLLCLGDHEAFPGQMGYVRGALLLVESSKNTSSERGIWDKS